MNRVISKVIKKEKSGYWIATSDTTAIFVSDKDEAKALKKGDDVAEKELKVIDLKTRLKAIQEKIKKFNT